MLSSRKVDELIYPAKTRALHFLAEAELAGIPLLVICTRRDSEAQDQLYAIGRTRGELDAAGLLHVEPRPGRIVTWAKGGFSFHQFLVALDVLPLRHGKPVWGTSGDGIDDDPSDDDRDDLELWQRVGAIGEASGLEWAGRWPRAKREFPHFQFPGGLAIADFRAGREIPRELWNPKRREAA